MTIAFPSKGTVVEVSWVDQSYYHGPVEAEGSIQPVYGTTVGFYLEHDSSWVSMAMEKFECPDQETKYRHIVTFPVTCIVSLIELDKDLD